MKSNNMNAVDTPELPLARKPEQVTVFAQLLDRQKNLAAAVALCIQLSGLDDKEIYLTLGIDAGHWSRMIKGNANFPLEHLPELMRMCGNEAPLLYLVKEMGYDIHSLRPLETETERKLRVAEERIAKLEAERAIEMRLLRDIRVAA